MDSTLSPDGRILTLSEAGQTAARFHAIWLRDNAWDAATRAPGNGQRLITLADIPSDTHISAASVDGDSLTLVFQPENKVIPYDLQALLEQRYDQPHTQKPGWTAPNVEPWDARLMGAVPVASLPQVQSDPHVKKAWLAQVARYGFGKLTDGPIRDGALFDVVDLFGYVRETNYGRKFEVRTEVNPTNLAYTGLGLQAHTDNPYRDPVPTVQVLYCLESSAAGGGEYGG